MFESVMSRTGRMLLFCIDCGDTGMGDCPSPDQGRRHFLSLCDWDGPVALLHSFTSLGIPVWLERWWRNGRCTWQRRRMATQEKKIISTLTAHSQAALQCCCSAHTQLIDLHCRLYRLGEDLARFPGCRCLKPSVISGHWPSCTHFH